jgi:hypothetical protein
MKLLRWVVRILATYIVAWVVSYLFYVGLDFQFFAEYWMLFWRGAGELPVFIQLTSWGITFITLGVWVGLRFVGRRKAMLKKGASAKREPAGKNEGV